MNTHFLTGEKLPVVTNTITIVEARGPMIPIEYFKHVNEHEFEDKILFEWLKARYDDEVNEHLFYVSDSTKKILHIAMKDFFSQLSPAWIEVILAKERKEANVIAIGELNTNDLSNYKQLTFYLKQHVGDIIDLDTARHACTFEPGSDSETKTLAYLREHYPNRRFEVMPWSEAFEATRHLE